MEVRRIPNWDGTAESTELYHHGIKGQKWGVRRYQNPDGTLTVAGRARLGRKEQKFSDKMDKRIAKSQKKDLKTLSERDSYKQRKLAKYDKKILATKRDIASFDPIKNGLKDRKGRDILTKKDVADSVNALKARQAQQEAKKKAWAKDFDEGTAYFVRGQKRYNDILKNYKNAKLSAMKDKAYKRDPNYKKAAKEYAKLCYDNAFSTAGSDYTKIKYAFDEAHKHDNTLRPR